MRTTSRGRAGLLLASSLLSACAAQYVSPEDPTLLVPDLSAAIAVGQASRAEVRAVLGTPRHSSAYWGFDLFRAETGQAAVAVAVTPWPVPFARFKDQLYRYTLVAYGPGDRADAVASGLFRRPPAWRNLSPISSDFPALHLRAGEILFLVDPEGARAESLLVSPRRRDDFLQRAPASAGCTVILGCGGSGCADQLSVDAGPPRRIALRTAHAGWFKAEEREPWLGEIEPQAGDPALPWVEMLVAVSLAAGEHVLEFSAKYLDGSASLNLACQPGELTYLVIQATAQKGFWRQALVDWRFERSDTMPARHARRALVVVDDGQWQVDP